MPKKRIALITIWFPPINGVAVNRMKAFASYLSDDFELEIFTVGKETKTIAENFGTVHYIKNSTLWSKIEHKKGDFKMIHHLKTIINLLSIKLNISKLKSWQKSVVNTLMHQHEKQSFDVLISSFAPVEAHNVAFAFKNKYPDVKWVADMRDEMSKNPFISASIQKRMQQKEIEFSEIIDAITTVSLPILDDFKAIFPKVKFFEEVRNGFAHNITPRKHFNEKFTFVYAGTFYGLIKPDHFFKVLVRLMKTKQISSDICIKFVGTHNNFTIPKEIQPLVEFIPEVPYLEAVKYMNNADCNLLLVPPMEAKGRFTGKLFDYLSVEKPILAMIDKSDVGATLIKEHNGGVVTDFSDEVEIEKGIISVYELWKNKIFLPIDSDKTKTLHRKHQVNKVKLLIQKLITD